MDEQYHYTELSQYVKSMEHTINSYTALSDAGYEVDPKGLDASLAAIEDRLYEKIVEGKATHGATYDAVADRVVSDMNIVLDPLTSYVDDSAVVDERITPPPIPVSDEIIVPQEYLLPEGSQTSPIPPVAPGREVIGSIGFDDDYAQPNEQALIPVSIPDALGRQYVGGTGTFGQDYTVVGMSETPGNNQNNNAPSIGPDDIDNQDTGFVQHHSSMPYGDPLNLGAGSNPTSDDLFYDGSQTESNEDDQGEQQVEPEGIEDRFALEFDTNSENETEEKQGRDWSKSVRWMGTAARGVKNFAKDQWKGLAVGAAALAIAIPLAYNAGKSNAPKQPIIYHPAAAVEQDKKDLADHVVDWAKPKIEALSEFELGKELSAGAEKLGLWARTHRPELVHLSNPNTIFDQYAHDGKGAFRTFEQTDENDYSLDMIEFLEAGHGDIDTESYLGASFMNNNGQMSVYDKLTHTFRTVGSTVSNETLHPVQAELLSDYQSEMTKIDKTFEDMKRENIKNNVRPRRVYNRGILVGPESDDTATLKTPVVPTDDVVKPLTTKVDVVPTPDILDDTKPEYNTTEKSDDTFLLDDASPAATAESLFSTDNKLDISVVTRLPRAVVRQETPARPSDKPLETLVTVPRHSAPKPVPTFESTYATATPATSIEQVTLTLTIPQEYINKTADAGVYIPEPTVDYMHKVRTALNTASGLTITTEENGLVTHSEQVFFTDLGPDASASDMYSRLQRFTNRFSSEMQQRAYESLTADEVHSIVDQTPIEILDRDGLEKVQRVWSTAKLLENPRPVMPVQHQGGKQ